jgi:hypothetical protein
MNTYETTNTYAADAFKYTLYASEGERNALFGYDYLQKQPLQQRYHQGYFRNDLKVNVRDIRQSPKDYYFDMKTRECEKTVIGPLNTRPNLYNDNVLPYTTTFERPNLYKSWQPLTTTAVPAMKGQYVQYIPHKPCEVAPNNDPKLWVADLNAKMYERSLISSAREQPFANWYRRQGLQNLVSQYVPPSNDPYTKKIARPDDTFCASLKRNGNKPPAVTSF